MERGLLLPITTSGLRIRAAQSRRKQKLSETMDTAPGTAEGGLWAFDASPMPVDPSRLQTSPDGKDEDVDMEDGGASLQTKASGFTASPSGMNKTVRLRLKLIQRQRSRIQKELGVPVGSDEKADEVQARLGEWTELFDENTK